MSARTEQAPCPSIPALSLESCPDPKSTSSFSGRASRFPCDSNVQADLRNLKVLAEAELWKSFVLGTKHQFPFLFITTPQPVSFFGEPPQSLGLGEDNPILHLEVEMSPTPGRPSRDAPVWTHSFFLVMKIECALDRHMTQTRPMRITLGLLKKECSSPEGPQPVECEPGGHLAYLRRKPAQRKSEGKYPSTGSKPLDKVWEFSLCRLNSSFI